MRSHERLLPASLHFGDSSTLGFEFGEDDGGLLGLIACGVDQHEVGEPRMSLQRGMPASCLAERGSRMVYQPAEQPCRFHYRVLQVPFAHSCIEEFGSVGSG
jgi:hypothetical protein